MTSTSADAAPETALGPSAYIVLGLLGQHGPGTSYDLKRWADESVGYFWTFPRSQLYAEPQRLTTLGLLAETQEDHGRRRRTYTITPAGRLRLTEWLTHPAGFPELRDPGLLKLFFSEQGTAQGLARLAAEQLALHQERLHEYERLIARVSHDHPEREPLRMGLLYERASVTFWTEVLG